MLFLRRLLSLTVVCAAAGLAGGARVARAQTEVKPYFLVIVDNSGSMNNSTGSGSNSCGQPRTRFNDAKCVVQKIVNSYGDVVFGLERFTQTTSGSCGCSESSLSCSGCNTTSGAGCPSSGSTASQGEILVPIEEDNQWKILEWVDFTCGSCGKTAGLQPELIHGTWTPIGGALRAARRYYEGLDPTFTTSPIAIDPYKSCRPYHVILLTDGDETCATRTSSFAGGT